MKKNYIRVFLALSLVILLLAGCSNIASAGEIGDIDNWVDVTANEGDALKTDAETVSGGSEEEKKEDTQTTTESSGSSSSELETEEEAAESKEESSSEVSKKELTEEEKLKEEEEKKKKEEEEKKKKEEEKKPVVNNSPYAIINLDGAPQSVTPGTHTINNSVGVNPSAPGTLTLNGAGEYNLTFTGSTNDITVDATAATTVILSGNSSGQTVTINGLGGKTVQLDGSGYTFGAAVGVNLTTSNSTLTIPSDITDPNITLKGNLTLTGTTSGTITLGGKKLTLTTAGSTFNTIGKGEVVISSGASTIKINDEVTIDGTAGTLTLDSTSTGTATIKGSAVNIGTNTANIVAGTNNLAITGTTTGTIALAGKTVTLNTPGTHITSGDGGVVVGGTSTVKIEGKVTVDATVAVLTLDNTSTGTATIKGSAVDIGTNGANIVAGTDNLAITGTTSKNINIGVHTVTLNTPGTHNITGTGTVKLGDTNGAYTIKPTSAITIDTTGNTGITVVDMPAGKTVKIKGDGKIQPINGSSTSILELDPLYTGEVDLAGTGYNSALIIKAGTNTLKVIPVSGKVDITVGDATSTIQIQGSATSVKVSSAVTTDLTVSATGTISVPPPLTATVDTSGMTKLVNAKLSNLGAKIEFNAPPSSGKRSEITGSRSPFTSLDISGNTALEDFIMKVNGAETATVLNATNINVIPDFTDLNVTGNTVLKNIDLKGLGIEASGFPIIGWTNAVDKTLDISGNGFQGDIVPDLNLLQNLESLILQNNPSSYIPWNDGPTAVGTSTTINVAKLLSGPPSGPPISTTPIKLIDLSGSTYVSEINFTVEANIHATDFKLISNSGLSVNITGHHLAPANKFNITGSIGNLTLIKDNLLSWPSGNTPIDGWLTLTGGPIGGTLKVDNNATIVTGGTIDFSTHQQGDAPIIDFKSDTDTKVPTLKISGRTNTLKYEDNKVLGVTILTVQGPGGASPLKDLTVPVNNNTDGGITMHTLNYKDIVFTTKALPDVRNWAGSIVDKTLNLVDDNGIVNAGEFYGKLRKSGIYLTDRGYHKLNIIDFGLNQLTHLNLSDQISGADGTVHTLKLDKTKLVTYNLKGNNKIVNGTPIGVALVEVFNVSNNTLTHVDYSGCTQLVATSSKIGGSDTVGLNLSGNKLVVAYIGGITDLLDIQLYNNLLSRADAVTALPNSNNTSGPEGLYLGNEGDGSKFHATAAPNGSVLNISDNPLRKIDFGDENGTGERKLGLNYILAAHGAGNIISDGVFVSHESTLKEINLAGQTVGTKGNAATGLYLNNNEKLTHLWGSTNTQATTTYPGGKMATNSSADNKIGLAVKENLDLNGSVELYGIISGVKRLEFNRTATNDHEIKNANLEVVTASDIQINDNIILEKVNIGKPEIVIENLELANNNIKTVRHAGAPGGSDVTIPADKAKLSGVIIIDENPLTQVLINNYDLIEFVSMNNSTFTRGVATKFRRHIHKFISVAGDMDLHGYAIDLSSNKKLLGIDILGNEVHGINLSKNPEIHSIYGTQNVNTGTAPTRVASTPIRPLATAATVDGSLVVGTFNMTETKNTNTQLIFAGHYIREANLSKSSLEKIDLRRNDGKGEAATMTGNLASPVYLDNGLDNKFSHQGILEQVNISEMINPIDKLYLDENKLTKIDSTATSPAGSKVFMAKTKFTPNSIMTINKNMLTDVTIVPGNGTNLEVLKELQLNDNFLTNLNFSKMTGLTTLRVNRTVADRNNFTDGTVNLSGATSLKEFAPSTIVDADKDINDKITRRRPNRPNESYWSIKAAVSDNGSAYNLDWIPKQSFENITEPSVPTYLTPFTLSEDTSGFYHYVEIKSLNIEGCTNLVTLRVPGNHLTTGAMNLTKTPNIKFLDISGKHYLTAKDGEYTIPNTDKKETQTDYFYGTGVPPAGYNDPLSGRLSGAFVSIWPKAENIYIYNNQYTSFNVAQSAGSIINILGFNNKMNSVEVSKAGKLQVLDVERNYIRPTIVLPTQSLIILRAGHNQISTYPNTPQVAGLQEIYLNHNNFPVDSSPAPITSNQKLKVLNVAVNNFKFVPSLEGNAALEEVYAFENEIANLPKLNQSGNLKVLDLHLNLISSITQSLPNSLRYLDISDNKFIDFPVPNIPTAMASTDGTVTAHERKPSHYFDGLKNQVVNGTGYSGTLNIRHNQIAGLPMDFHNAWVAFNAGSPTKIRDFYLEYNLLDIDVYDNDAPLYGGTQKWLRSIDYDYIFIIQANYEQRAAEVIPNLRFYHPLRQTYEIAPRAHFYDIWLNVEDNIMILDHQDYIVQTINNATMYARVVTRAERDAIRDGSARSSSYNPGGIGIIKHDIYTAGIPSRAKTARNKVAVMNARLIGPDTVWEPWESSSITGKDKDGTSKSKGKYNPTTGPK